MNMSGFCEVGGLNGFEDLGDTDSSLAISAMSSSIPEPILKEPCRRPRGDNLAEAPRTAGGAGPEWFSSAEFKGCEL